MQSGVEAIFHPRGHGRARRSAWRQGLGEFWYRFAQNRLAVIGLAIVVIMVFLALAAPWLTVHDPARPDFRSRMQGPVWTEGGEWSRPLGTDHLGRDILTRMLYGARISLAVGLVVVGFATVLGISLGLASGFYGGRIDAIIQRLVDTLLSFPYLIFAIALVSVLGPGYMNMVLALVYKEWIYPCRVVRGDVLAAKAMEYVEAARSVGASNGHIMFRELLPNVLASVIVVSSLRVAWVILMEASLSFLSLGVQPPHPAWGLMISEGREYIYSAWWIATFPGLAILITVLGINLAGEGLRDALDPRLRE